MPLTPDNVHMRKDGVFEVNLWCPRRKGEVEVIEVGLMDVRSADSIRISYDFGRDGYVIRQASTFVWDGHDTVRDADWQEVAFVKAWGREAERLERKTDEP